MGHNESFPSVCPIDMRRMSTQSSLHVKIEDLPDMDEEELDKKFDKTMATVGAMVQKIRERRSGQFRATRAKSASSKNNGWSARRARTSGSGSKRGQRTGPKEQGGRNGRSRSGRSSLKR